MLVFITLEAFGQSTGTCCKKQKHIYFLCPRRYSFNAPSGKHTIDASEMGNISRYFNDISGFGPNAENVEYANFLFARTVC